VQTLAQIKDFLAARGLAPKRSLGQNFLVDHNLILKLVNSAGVKTGDLVLEIGPGTGTMTEELLVRGCEVVACELDDALAALNRERLPSLLATDQQHRFRLIHGDCLAGKRALNPDLLTALQSSGGRQPAANSPRPFSLVSNLPYGAATALLTTLLLHHPECSTMSVTIQKELGDRLTAKPRTKDYGPIAVIAQLTCRIEKVATAPPGCFWPQPDVTSTMLTLRRLPDGPVPETLAKVSELCDVIFAHRRKQLGSGWNQARQTLGLPDWDALRAVRGLENTTPAMRGEEFSPEQVLAMVHVWMNRAGS
jgi:16S rRNA (adenine1518-N6/adenine1519-N6)-dimethyltransferase